MNVTIEDRNRTRLACVRHIGPYFEIGKSFAELGQKLASAGIPQDQVAEMVAVYYDDPNTTAPSDLKSDAGVILADGIEIPSSLTEQHLVAGRYAVVTHMGSYAGLADAWAQFYGKDLPANDLKWIDAPCFEIYRNDCREVSEQELRTDLYVPIQN